MVKTYLDDLERRIDPRVEEDLIRAWRDFTDGRTANGIFSPRRPAVSAPGICWPEVLIDDAIEDFDAMALQQLRMCSAALEAGNGSILCVRSNYGTGIIPTLFGAELFMMDRGMNTLPTSIPLPSPVDAAKRIIERGVPDLNRGLGGKALEMGRRFTALFRSYPKIARYVHLYHPDMQGPMDVCELLWGSGLFLDLVDRPDLVKALLALIADTYVAFMEEWDRITPPSGGYAVHWSLFHRGHIMLRDDSAMNLSPAMFREFIEPYDQRLLDRFGGGAVHFCGRGDHFIERIGQMRGVHAVAMSQPEYNDMEVIFRNTVDKGIRLLSLQRAAAEAALKRGRPLHGLVHCW